MKLPVFNQIIAFEIITVSMKIREDTWLYSACGENYRNCQKATAIFTQRQLAFQPQPISFLQN